MVATDEVTVKIVTRSLIEERLGPSTWLGKFVLALADRFREADREGPDRERRLVAPRRRRGVRLLFFQVAALPRFARERLAALGWTAAAGQRLKTLANFARSSGPNSRVTTRTAT